MSRSKWKPVLTVNGPCTHSIAIISADSSFTGRGWFCMDCKTFLKNYSLNNKKFAIVAFKIKGEIRL